MTEASSNMGTSIHRLTSTGLICINREQDANDHNRPPVAKRAGRPRLEPPLDAVQVEYVATGAPGDAETRVVVIPCSPSDPLRLIC